MRPTLFLSFILWINFSVFGQGTKSHIVYFETNSHQLQSAEKQKLKTFFELFDISKITEIKLLGHTDSDGEDQFNEVLSNNRTKAVKRNLLLHGLVSAKQEGFGEKKPVNTNATITEKARNRRVEVEVSYSKGGLLTYENYKVLRHRNLSTAEFCIDPLRDTVLILPKGGRVIFEARTFPADGNCVTITAKEAYKKSEIVLANLGTVSNGNLLESGGMIRLEAFNSSGVKLESIKPFTVQFPTEKPLDDMMIFNGEHLADSSVNWIQPSFTPWIPDELLEGCFDNYGGFLPQCEECRFFFCRLKRFPQPFKGMFNRIVKSENKTFRSCQRYYRTLRKQGLTKFNADSLLAAMQQSRQDLCAETKAKMDSLGLKTLQELRAYNLAEQKKAFVKSLEAGTAVVDNVMAYSMRSNSMGWINCDRFSRIPADKKINPFILAEENENDLRNAQCSIILENKTSVIGAKRNGKKFNFTGLPKQMAVFVVAVLMRKGKIFLSMERTTVQANMPKFKFKEVSYEELEKALGQLD